MCRSNQNEKEQPQKVNDHACDALRYLAMSLPETAPDKDDIYKKIKYESLEGSLYRDLARSRSPKERDPFGDN